MSDYPKVLRTFENGFVQRRPYISIDFEYMPDTLELTIMGVCSGADPVSVDWSPTCRKLLGLMEQNKPHWLGHNSLVVEREIIQSELGEEIPLERCEDSMLMMYLCNADLCKGVDKKAVGDDEEDAGSKRGVGFMDLWSMASLYTNLPAWKSCRGERCEGPCWTHDKHGYNGIDALAPDLAYPLLSADMDSKGIPDTLYQNLKRLTVMCHRMSERGIKVDRELVARLEADFNARKDAIFSSEERFRIGKKGQTLKTKEVVWNAPFNPKSSQQIKAYFNANGVALEDTDKDAIQQALDRLGENVAPEVEHWLSKLHEYKDAGKGLKAWTDARFMGRDGLYHPRFIVTGTSTGRLSSASPNFQNIPRTGWGREVRAAIVPRDKDLMLVKADKSQLELRVCLWYAGIEPPQGDAFAWLVEQGNGLFEKIAADNPSKDWTPRDWTKSISHGADYLEGVKVLTAKDLDSPRNKTLMANGALVVNRDWEYHGGVVAFTGANLAERLFGSASWQNRAKANKIQEAYFSRFDVIRQWHRKISRDAERGYVQSASGRFLTLHGTPEDKLKIAAAMLGQGSGADDVQDAMLRFDAQGATPILQVHDELVFEFDKGTDDKTLLDFFSTFSQECQYMPGFRCPVKVSKGPNWRDMTVVGAV